MRKAITFIYPYKGPVICVLILSLFISGLGALEPLVLKYIFDKLDEKSVSTLLIGVLMLTAISVLREIKQGFSNWYTWKIRLKLNHDLMEKTIGRLFNLPISFHNSETVGGTMTRVEKSINGLVGALCEITFNILPGVIYLFFSICIMFKLSWQLSIIVLLFAPLPAIISVFASPEQANREKNLLEIWTKIFSRLYEAMSGILTVKISTMESSERARFLTDVDKANSIVLNGVGTDTKINFYKNLIMLLAKIGVILASGFLIAKGMITVGTLIAFLGYMGNFFTPVQGLTNIYQIIKKANVSLEAIFSIINSPYKIETDNGSKELGQEVQGGIVFENVSFAYSGKKVLDDISFRILPGEKIAFVGESGSGKTTTVSMLENLYEPQSGKITIDGIDLKEMKISSLRSKIGMVLQDYILFNDTILNNISYGCKPGTTLEDVITAAKFANAHEFIMRLPEQYETKVGERGKLLSAGEKQRINIARAFLKNPKIIILDEATSALDSESENLVQKGLNYLTRGRTVIIIAHRLSTISGVDRIYVFKHGKIIESGTHEELIDQNGYYSLLVSSQIPGSEKNYEFKMMDMNSATIYY